MNRTAATQRQQEPVEDIASTRPGQIVVGVDGSEASEPAVRWASETAAQRHRTLRIVHGYNLHAARAVRRVHDAVKPPVVDTIRRRGAEILAAAREQALGIDPSLPVETELSEKGAARRLIDLSATADLTVLGASGHGSTLTHLGSTLLSVVAHGHGRVVVACCATPGRPAHRHGPIVVGLDGSRCSEAAAAAAFAEAAARGAPLIAIHTWHDLRAHWFAGMPDMIEDPPIAEAADARLRSWLADWMEKYPGVRVTRRTYLAGPDLHLIQWSESAQLIVVGSRGRGGFRGLLLGSKSNIVVQRAHCPVLVAHAT
ncbi:universal stress protein [Nocardia grenadensis]|uniref:universal stress protein n=1 Tax=Nocardia grenadensis TaxID=931537 RepID=UPI000A077B78|nr:universal stress protein [Nocardia grenadensis]